MTERNETITEQLTCTIDSESIMYKKILQAVETFILTMVPGHRYPAESILPESLWDNEFRGKHVKVGRFLAYAVQHGQVDLIFAQRNGTTVFYKLAGQ